MRKKILENALNKRLREKGGIEKTIKVLETQFRGTHKKIEELIRFTSTKITRNLLPKNFPQMS